MARFLIRSALAFLVIIPLLPHLAIAQERLLERLSEQEAENNPEAENALQALLAHPLEVNRVTRQDLLQFPFLTSAQIDAFLSVREKSNGFENLNEAMGALAVTGDTLVLCQKIFFLARPKKARALKVATRLRITHPAAVDSKWLGAPYRAYERATISTEALSFGLLAERDPGEPRWNDHGLLYARWQNGTAEKGWQLVAGSYQIEWARGLVFWGPYGSSIAADVHAAGRRQGRGLLPYLSGDENAALRGAGWSWHNQRLSLLAFASSQRLNVTLQDGATVKSLYESGYHRVPIELARRKALREHLAGAAIKFSWQKKLLFGAMAYTSEYDKHWVRPDLEQGYFDFFGHSNHVLGAFLSLSTSEMETNLELARSRAGGVAGSAVIGGGFPLLKWTAESHYYARDFHSLHGRNANTIGDSPQSEFGFSLGISSRLRRGLTAEIFAAKQDGLWRTRLSPLPSSTWSTGARLDWRIRREATMQWRWQQTRDEALARRSGRWKLDYQVAPAFRLASRLDLVWRTPVTARADMPRDNAVALTQDLRWEPRRQLLIISRYVLFDAPGGASIYQYEHDLPGTFTNVALRERGRRWYFYLHYTLTSGLELSFKRACTEQDDSILKRNQSCAWGLQLDGWLPIHLP
jgi:hypothetical protein